MENTNISGSSTKVHGMFWILVGLVALDSFLRGTKNEFPILLLGVVILVAVLSTIIFTFLHARAHVRARKKAGASSIHVIYNGLAVFVTGSGQFTKSQILKIGLAGPILNLVFAGIAYALLASPLVVDPSDPLSIDVPIADLSFAERAIGESVRLVFFINLFLGALNLLPVLPLDAGQILGGLLPRERIRALIWVGVLLGGMLAAFGFVSGRMLMPYIFTLIALHNLMVLRGKQIRAF